MILYTLYPLLSRSVRADELVMNAKFCGGGFKQRRTVAFGIGKTVGELKAVVCLNAFHGHTLSEEGFNDVPQKVS